MLCCCVSMHTRFFFLILTTQHYHWDKCGKRPFCLCNCNRKCLTIRQNVESLDQLSPEPFVCNVLMSFGFCIPACLQFFFSCSLQSVVSSGDRSENSSIIGNNPTVKLSQQQQYKWGTIQITLSKLYLNHDRRKLMRVPRLYLIKTLVLTLSIRWISGDGVL